MTNKLLEMDSCTGSSFTHQLCSSNQKKKLYIQREKSVLHVAFPQTAIYNYGTKEFTLKCMVRKWALMCIGKAREGCSSVTNFCLQMWGAPGDLMVKNPVANAGDTGLIPGSEDPLRGKRQPIPVFLAWKSHGHKKPSRLLHGIARVKNDLVIKQQICKCVLLGKSYRSELSITFLYQRCKNSLRTFLCIFVYGT